jgi:hypothetical protein
MCCDRRNKGFDLYEDECLDCGENEETLNCYEQCRGEYINKLEKERIINKIEE